MIWNSVHLPEEWDISILLGKHSSEPYNPDVANAFFRAGMIESWGRGIEHINQSCKDAGVSLPEFSYEHTGLWVRFSFATQGDVKTDPLVKLPGKTSEETSEKIIRAIKKDQNITIITLAEIVGVSTRSIERNIKNLRQNNTLKRVGPKKGGHWKVLK